MSVISNPQHYVSFSGGMGSFAEAKRCVDLYGVDKVTCIFLDVKMEDEDTYRFVSEAIKFLGCRLITLTENISVWELFKRDGFIGDNLRDTCSLKLKRRPMVKFIKGLADCIALEVHLGIDYSESHRLDAAKKIMAPIVYRSTLVEEHRIVHKNFSEQFGIRRPRLYTLGFGHNNCGGFCVKAGLGQFKLLFEKLPERYLWHEGQEAETIALGALPFLRKTTNGVKRYLTLKEYREEFLEPGKADEDTHSTGGCGCALPTSEDLDE